MTRLHAWWIGTTLWAALALAVNARAEEPPAAIELELRGANGSADYDLLFENLSLFGEPSPFAEIHAKPLPRPVQTWGVHPASPTPGYAARWMLLNDTVRPAGAQAASGEKKAAQAAAYEVEVDDDKACPLCPAGKAKCCEEAKDGDEPQPSEAAKAILDLMDSLGRSVLDGTVFRKPDPENERWLKHIDESKEVSPRKALIQYIRALEAESAEHAEKACKVGVNISCCDALSCQQGCTAKTKCDAACPSTCADYPAECPAGCPANCQSAVAVAKAKRNCVFTVTACDACPGQCTECPCDECPMGIACRQCPCAVMGERIGVDFSMVAHHPENERAETLASAWQTLEMTANSLEEQKLYERADQLRDLARQLRMEARTAQANQEVRTAPQTTWYQPLPPRGECVTWTTHAEAYPAPPSPPAMMPIPRVYFSSPAQYTLPLPAPPTHEHGMQAEVEHLRRQLHQLQQALQPRPTQPY